MLKRRKAKAPPPLPEKLDEVKPKLEPGFKVSETGTLRVDLFNGKDVAVRSEGLTSPRESGPELIGKVLWSQIKIGHVIGQGSQAKVRKVRDETTGSLYALKSIPLDKSITKNTLQQELLHIITPSNHHNLVASTDAFYIEGSLKVLMEYMDCGSLHNVLKVVGCCPFRILAGMTSQILDGLQSLHVNNRVHRDIKPSNLLINSNGEVKISDFGVATFLNSLKPYALTNIGSTAYMSPERVRGQHYGVKSDIWSLGLTIAQCALGVFPILPYNSNSDEDPFNTPPNMFDLAAFISEGKAVVDFSVLIPKINKYRPNLLVNIPDELRDFVRICLEQDPETRAGCKELQSHPFVTNYKASKEDLSHWLKSNGLVSE